MKVAALEVWLDVIEVVGIYRKDLIYGGFCVFLKSEPSRGGGFEEMAVDDVWRINLSGLRQGRRVAAVVIVVQAEPDPIGAGLRRVACVALLEQGHRFLPIGHHGVAKAEICHDLGIIGIQFKADLQCVQTAVDVATEPTGQTKRVIAAT